MARRDEKWRFRAAATTDTHDIPLATVTPAFRLIAKERNGELPGRPAVTASRDGCTGPSFRRGLTCAPRTTRHCSTPPSPDTRSVRSCARREPCRRGRRMGFGSIQTGTLQLAPARRHARYSSRRAGRWGHADAVAPAPHVAGRNGQHPRSADMLRSSLPLDFPKPSNVFDSTAVIVKEMSPNRDLVVNLRA